MTAPVPRSPQLHSRRVRLKTVELSDYDYLWRVINGAESTVRWRFRGATPSPESFRELLWQGVLAQFMIQGLESGEPVGLISAFDAQFANGIVHLSIIVDEPARSRGWPLEAVPLFVEYLFVNWPFRKVYVESIEFNALTFLRGSRRLFDEEARLIGHDYFRGRYWDVVIMSLERARWSELRERYLPLLGLPLEPFSDHVQAHGAAEGT